MIVELINTGSELLLGRTLNTHQQWLCRHLADLGYVVSRQIAIADTGPDIEQAVRESLSRADLVITTGGLGPTADDLTRDLIAKLLNRPLLEDPSVLEHLNEFYARRNRTMPERVKVQARVPAGAVVLPNLNGTAPGLAMALSPNPFRPANKPSWLIMLPGPPRELRPMFEAAVTPLLERELPLPHPFVCRTLRTVNLPESIVEEKVAGDLAALMSRGLELGYCARVGQVDVRLVSRQADAHEIVAAAAGIVRERLGAHICAEDDEEIETTIVKLLTARKQTLALAESCTGGLLAHRITNVPGASMVFRAGLVTYANDAKQTLLGVSRRTLDHFGAVSAETVRAMAEGARKITAADYAVAITGIAGPGGGSVDKPVGTVFFAVASDTATLVTHKFNPLDRETFKQVTAAQAFEALRGEILKSSPP